MKILKLFSVALFCLSALPASPAIAACSWEVVCDDYGNCPRIPVCNSLSEFKSPIAPKGNPPSVPPGVSCHQQKVCTPYGNCTLKMLCM